MESSPRGTVFLTGSTGFIGSRVIQDLCLQGWRVRGLVRDKEKARALFGEWEADYEGQVELVEGDLFSGTPAERMKLFRDCLSGSHLVIHLAEAKSKIKEFDAKNIKTFGLLLEAAAESRNLQRFVFVSAFMAGGLPQPLPPILTEEMTGVQFPDPYYSWKRSAERLLMKASKESHFSYSIIRPALVYGPKADWLVPMLTAIRRFGRYYLPLPNGGNALLGTVHVEDVANTIASAGANRYAENQIIHAVDNGGTTYKDWMNTIAAAAGWKVRIGSIPSSLTKAAAKEVDAASSIFGLHYGASLWAQVLSEGCGYSNEKMKRIIGNLKYPTIREGIPGMMDWFKTLHS